MDFTDQPAGIITKRIKDLESSGLKVKNTFLHIDSAEDDFFVELPDMRRLVTEPAPETPQRPRQVWSEVSELKISLQEEEVNEDDQSTEGGQASDKSDKKQIRKAWTCSDSSSSVHSDKKIIRKEWASSDSNSSYEPEGEPASFAATACIQYPEMSESAFPFMMDSSFGHMAWPMSPPVDQVAQSYPAGMWQGAWGPDYAHEPPRPTQPDRMDTRPQVDIPEPRSPTHNKRVGSRKANSLITLAQKAQKRQQELEEQPDSRYTRGPYAVSDPQNKSEDADTKTDGDSQKSTTNSCPSCGGATRAHFKFCSFCGYSLG